MNIFKNKNVIALVVAVAFVATACNPGPAKDSTQGKTQKVTETYSQAAIEAVPYPLEQMKAGGWLERRNVRERLVRYADPNKLSYIYLFSDQGQLMANYTVKGKVSNTASQLTTDQIVTDVCDGSYCPQVLNAPMDDATWGPSEDAIFFFTTDGVMIQWTGNYVLSDAPLNMTSTPVLVYNEGSQPSNVGDESKYGGS